jgi:hypothetical protein
MGKAVGDVAGTSDQELEIISISSSSPDATEVKLSVQHLQFFFRFRVGAVLYKPWRSGPGPRWIRLEDEFPLSRETVP